MALFTTLQSQASAIDGENLIDKAVLITCGDAIGAGFFIQENLVATARHVVDGCTRATIENNHHESSTGTVVMKKTDLDIAFIMTQSTIASIVTFDKKSPRAGATVSIVGAPIDGLVLSTGTLRDIGQTSGGYTLSLDIPADHGNSGGPVFSEGGLIGLIVAKSDFGLIYGYGEEEIIRALSAKTNSRTDGVKSIKNDTSQLENLLLISFLMNAVLLIAVTFLLAKRKRFNKNQVIINL